MVAMERGRFYIGGPLQGLETPTRDFPCATPAEVRAMLPDDKDVVAFQCRNPIHRAHYELFTRALDDKSLNDGAVVLVHPTCGPTQPGDIPGDVRYRTYEVLKEETANPRTFWAYLPYSMHMAGPREAIHHMMIRKNFGCTHFIIGHDMAEEAKEKELSALKLSGTKFRKMLRGGEDIPEWFAFKSVVEVLRQTPRRVLPLVYNLV